jgi:YjjG family noncanonical pyrimidine nucleotidase
MDTAGLRVLLLDADNTIFDFDAAQREALLETIGLSPRDPAADEAFAAFKDINDAAWRRHEAGTLSRQDLRVERFKLFRAFRPFEMDDCQAADFFLGKLACKGLLLPGAADTLAELKRAGLRLGLATNGFSAVQRGRIKASGLDGLLDGIFISEEMGAKKPDSVFFEACLLALDADKSECLMVGDSPEADIAGGKAAGLACAWVNSHGLPYPPALPSPDLELRSLNDLPRALGIGL